MGDLFVVRVAGVFALLAVVAQVGAIATAILNGIQPGAFVSRAATGVALLRWRPAATP